MAIHVIHILLTFLLLVLLFTYSLANPITYNVISFGAKPDGDSDSTDAFVSAWTSACSSPSPADISVPPGRYRLQNAVFKGPCKNSAITIKIEATLVAPSDYNVIGHVENWLYFDDVDGVSIYGGVLDGQGASMWDCKSSGKNCPNGATSLRFSNSKNIVLSGVTSQNSQLFHIVFNGCENVKLQDVKISAAGNSPNTDGVHVQSSSNVSIMNSQIATGDDCVSIGPGTNGLWIENVACGPGHGISVGSLGKNYQEAGVQNITVTSVNFTNTQNGLRIKSWGRQSTGFARNILFQHVIMNDVEHPIIIDQNYCPHHQGCPGGVSGVKINDVTYLDIQGTSTKEVAVKFDCSSVNPCSGIIMKDVNLTYKNQQAQAYCMNALGTASGILQPSSCLQTGL